MATTATIRARRSRRTISEEIGPSDVSNAYADPALRAPPGPRFARRDVLGARAAAAKRRPSARSTIRSAMPMRRSRASRSIVRDPRAPRRSSLVDRRDDEPRRRSAQDEPFADTRRAPELEEPTDDMAGAHQAAHLEFDGVEQAPRPQAQAPRSGQRCPRRARAPAECSAGGPGASKRRSRRPTSSLRAASSTTPA